MSSSRLQFPNLFAEPVLDRKSEGLHRKLLTGFVGAAALAFVVLDTMHRGIMDSRNLSLSPRHLYRTETDGGDSVRSMVATLWNEKLSVFIDTFWHPLHVR